MKAMRGVQMAAKNVGEAFTGSRDFYQMLHALHSTTVSVEAYFGNPTFARVLPEELRKWAASLCGEAKEAYGRLRKRVEQMEKDGVRGAAETSLHALSSAAGAITGIAMLDVGRHIADELIQTTSALNDVLARATRLVTLANCAMLERLAEEKGLSMPTAMEINPMLTKLEIENIRGRIWVHQVEDGSVVAGDTVTVTWDTVGIVPTVNVRLKNCMGVETSRGKTVQRLTPEAGEPNKGFVNDTLPLDFVPGKYTVAVSDPANTIRGMTFLSVLRPISVADITEPASGMGRSIAHWRGATWNRGTTHRISWRMNRGKASMLRISIAVSPSVDGPWRILRGAAELKFKVPEAEPKEDQQARQMAAARSAGAAEHQSATSRDDPESPRVRRLSEACVSDDGSGEVAWGTAGARGGEDAEWFSDDRTKAPRAKAIASTVGTTFSSLMSGAWGSGGGGGGAASGGGAGVDAGLNESGGRGVGGAGPGAFGQWGSGFEVSDEYHLADTHCLDCNFDWFVPVEIEPGKYLFRISPIGTTGNHSFTEKEQVLRSRDSGFITIS